MAKVTIVKCDVTGETFEEGTPGTASFTIRPVKPDNYEELSETAKLPFVAHQFDLSAEGVAKLRALGGTRGTTNSKGGRPSPSVNGAASADDGQASPSSADSPEPAPAPAESASQRTARLRRERAGATK